MNRPAPSPTTPSPAPEVEASPPPGDDEPTPLVSMLLIAYRQADTVGEAIAGALAQTWQPLEILISDDASDDGTWEAIERVVAGYDGPHRVVLNRNPRNLGIGAHLSALATRARGELMVVAAGDDVSLPERCSLTVAAWMARGRRPDLIAAPLVDIDAEGCTHGELRPSDLGRWRSAADWVAERPHVIGAGQAWSRRLVQRFDPLPEGTVAEDLVMVFRAIVSGGAISLDEPLVRYRRGGISRRCRALCADDVKARLLKNAQHTMVEVEQLLEDARHAGVLGTVGPALHAQLARERHALAQLGPGPATAKWRRAFGDPTVPSRFRMRLAIYSLAPWLLAPFFGLKRWLARGD